jgi:LPS export ABC transporter protein LptC
MRTRNVLSMLALALLAACEPPPPSAPVAAESDTSQRTYGMNLKLSEAGVLKADLYGDTAFQRPGSADVTELRNVRLTFYDAQGKKPGTLTSKTGEYDVRTGIMVARGSVVLITHNEKGEKRTIRSEELSYDQRGDRVWSERETLVNEANGQTLVSQGFTSDTRFTNIQGTNARTTGVRVNQSGPGL